MSETDIRKYAELMGELGLTGLEINEQKGSIRLERNEGGRAGAGAAAVPAEPEAAQQSAASSYTEVKSPIVGIFYQAPMENAEPFIKVGDKVKKGDVLAIVEAMKLMNEITAEVDGIVREVCVQNGQAVDYSCTLFRIEEQG